MTPKAALMTLMIPLAGCVAPVAETDTTPEAGFAFFQADCAACHGVDGRGAGDFGRELFQIPPDLTTLARDNGGTFPRDYVIGVIDGYDRGDHFSRAMPEFGAGDMGPTVIVEGEDGLGTPIPARLLALAAYLESIQEN